MAFRTSGRTRLAMPFSDRGWPRLRTVSGIYSRWTVPLGASGHPGSAHYADQTSIWAEVDLIPMTYQWDAIEAEAESHQSLKLK